MLGRHTDVFYEDGDCADDFGGTEETAILKGCQEILHLLVPANGIHYAVKILRKPPPARAQQLDGVVGDDLYSLQLALQSRFDSCRRNHRVKKLTSTQLRRRNDDENCLPLNDVAVD